MKSHSFTLIDEFDTGHALVKSFGGAESKSYTDALRIPPFFGTPLLSSPRSSITLLLRPLRVRRASLPGLLPFYESTPTLPSLSRWKTRVRGLLLLLLLFVVCSVVFDVVRSVTHPPARRGLYLAGPDRMPVVVRRRAGSAERAWLRVFSPLRNY